MKLTNHQKDNFYSASNAIMRGTIEMTRKEYAKVQIYLQAEYLKACRNGLTYTRDSLDMKSILLDSIALELFSIGVSATKLVVQHYHLPHYKNQNYAIKII